VREVAHARKQNPLSDLNKNFQVDRYPRPNHLCKFWWWSVKGFSGGGGSNLPFSIDFDRRPYNTVWLGAIITDTDAPRILIAGDFNCDINSRFYVELCKFVCTEGKQNGSEQTIAALYNTLLEKGTVVLNKTNSSYTQQI